LCAGLLNVALILGTLALWWWAHLVMLNYEDHHDADVDPPAWSAESMEPDERVAFHVLSWGALALGLVGVVGVVSSAVGFERASRALHGASPSLVDPSS
jgi:hypothetical protein